MKELLDYLNIFLGPHTFLGGFIFALIPVIASYLLSQKAKDKTDEYEGNTQSSIGKEITDERDEHKTSIPWIPLLGAFILGCAVFGGIPSVIQSCNSQVPDTSSGSSMSTASDEKSDAPSDDNQRETDTQIYNETEAETKIDFTMPYNMTDVFPAYQSGGNPYTEYSAIKSGYSNFFTMAGKKYYNGMTFSADVNAFTDTCWAVYYLNRNCRKIEFTLCHVDGTDAGENNVLQVFYDGILKEEIEMSADMAPKHVTLDVIDVTQLKFQVRPSGTFDPLYGLGDPIVYFSETVDSNSNKSGDTKTYLTDVFPAYQSGGNPYTEYSAINSGYSSYFTMGGEKYYNGMTFDADVNVFADLCWAVYYLNSEYKKLEFTVCHVDGTDVGEKNALQVFYDGVLKEEIELAPDMAPKQVSLDITGVGQLKFQVKPSGTEHPLYGVGNPVLK